MGSRSASSTALRILAAFMETRTWRQAELADHLGLTPETVRRHLLALCEEDVPFERQAEGSQVYWSAPSQWIPGGVVLDSDWLETLLRLLARTPSCRARDELVRKLTRAMPYADVWRRHLEVVLPGSNDAHEWLDGIEDGAARHLAQAIQYHSLSRGEVEWRTLSVQRVVRSERFIAYCHRSAALRWFRLDCVLHVRPAAAGVAYHRAPDEEVEHLVRTSVSGFTAAEPLRELTFVVHAPAHRWVVRNMPIEEFTAVAHGPDVRITVRTSALEPIARFVLGLGGAATPETPALREAVAQLAHAALARLHEANVSTETFEQSRITKGSLEGESNSETVERGATVVPSRSPSEGRKG